LIDSRGQILSQDLQEAVRRDAGLLADILNVLIAECAAQLIAVHGHVFAFAEPGLDLLVQASRAQLLNETCKITQPAPFQNLNERRVRRRRSGAWLASLNLVGLGLPPLRLLLRRLSWGFLLLHSFVQRTRDGIEDTSHPSPPLIELEMTVAWTNPRSCRIR
jgi:hypothetical protein